MDPNPPRYMDEDSDDSSHFVTPARQDREFLENTCMYIVLVVGLLYLFSVPL